MDNELLKMLYRKYKREIYLYLYSMCRNADTAEELMQETFLKALLSLSENHTNMRAWLYMVARNLYFNHRKTELRTEPRDEITLEEDIKNSDILGSVIRTEQHQLLFKALQTLSDNKRDILLLQYFNRLSQKEISEILKITPANVRVLALRAKREIKQYMEEHGYDIP
ncbi:MAG: RNA polymerase sigma factor [Anaerofustis stercorihominis]|nr:RNA polymerase sigma factor [Anaerofustis stercorihominis]